MTESAATHVQSEDLIEPKQHQAWFSISSLFVYSRKVSDLMSSSNPNAAANKLAKLERRTDSIDTRLKRMEEKLLPIPWKYVVWISGALVVLVTTGLGFYVNRHVPTEIDATVGPLSTRIETLEKQSTNNQFEQFKKELSAAIESVRSSLSEKIDNNDSRINQRLDNYINGIARDPRSFKHSYAHSISTKRAKLKQTLPVAQELLVRARNEGTVLGYRDLNALARLTLSLLDRKYQDQNVREQVWNTAWELASYKSFVDGKF
ncbi:MAG TPA: hypothetical protein VJW17_13140, partial [Pyrinomonadaceae bacterium]|nr:hypothetical protein [Pyrinomonadaceae bacterium]